MHSPNQSTSMMANLNVQAKMVCLIFVTMLLVVSPHVTQGLTCMEVLKMVMPCMNYITKGGSIPVNCCSGVKNLASSAKTRSDRQQACRCIQPVAKSVNINYDLANKLPGACGVVYKINIKPNMDCSTVQN